MFVPSTLQEVAQRANDTAQSLGQLTISANLVWMMTSFIYPLYANWVWGGGWLSALGRNYGLGHGHVDFAGSSVVHMTGGLTALVTCKLLGPRLGKYNADGSPNPIPGHNIPMAVLGTYVLCFGWFGFNPGSTLAANDTRFVIVAVNTMLASGAGGLSATLLAKMKFGKPDPTWMCNGLLAGCVAITGPCAFVSSFSSIFIGAVAGLLVIGAALFVETTLKVDDPVGAVAVHGANGVWGILALGYVGDPGISMPDEARGADGGRFYPSVHATGGP